MNEDQLDELLRTLPEEKHVTEPLDDGVLLAYRDGRLPPERREAVERRLAVDAEARALLAALSEPVDPREVERLSARGLRAPAAGRRAVWGSLAAVAVAAGVAVVVMARPPEAYGRYALEVEGGEAAVRGAAPRELVVGEGSRLVVRLRAEAPSDAPRALGVFLERDGRLVPVPEATVSARRGSFEVRLEGDRWLGDGPQRVWLVLGRDAEGLRALVGTPVEPGGGRWSLDVEHRKP